MFLSVTTIMPEQFRYHEGIHKAPARATWQAPTNSRIASWQSVNKSATLCVLYSGENVWPSSSKQLPSRGTQVPKSVCHPKNTFDVCPLISTFVRFVGRNSISSWELSFRSLRDFSSPCLPVAPAVHLPGRAWDRRCNFNYRSKRVSCHPHFLCHKRTILRVYNREIR